MIRQIPIICINVVIADNIIREKDATTENALRKEHGYGRRVKY